MNYMYDIVYFCLLFDVLLSQKIVGDHCVLKRTGENGVCSLLKDCPPALLDLQYQRIPETCSFQGLDPIICCTSVTSTTVKSTTTKEEMQPGDIGYKSQEKCATYGKLFNKISIIPLIPQPNVVILDTCPISAMELIIQGNVARPKEFPHMVLIGYDSPNNTKKYLCSGSLISENYVLTAALCLISLQYGNAKYARFGDLDIKREDDDADPQEINIIELIRHPEYIPRHRYNNIGLIKLEKNVIFSRFVKPICLNINRYVHAEKAIVTGWGSVEYLEKITDPLYKLYLNLIGHEKCSESIGSYTMPINETTQLCATQTNSKLCQGDIGGPLQIYHKDVYCMYSLIGVTSQPTPCGITNFPGIYTRVSNYIDWIEKIVWADMY